MVKIAHISYDERSNGIRKASHFGLVFLGYFLDYCILLNIDAFPRIYASRS